MEEGFQIKWHIIGEGWQRHLLEKIILDKKIQNNIELLGKKLNPYPYLNACDIYMQPSRHEGYCIALAEARAFCKPIIATDFAGAREQLTDQVTGLITEYSADNLYRTLKQLIVNKELRNRLSLNLQSQTMELKEQVATLEHLLDNP